jgi:SAM-dependent methyltransferase
MSLDPSLTIKNFFAQSQEMPVNNKWDTLWQNSHTPWDRGEASPALVELLQDKHFQLLPPGKSGTALVPGCGRGYDVALLAGLTADGQKFEKVVGLDVSPKAMEEAKRVHQSTSGAEFVVGDFFSKTEDWAKTAYDVVYDYTVRPLYFLIIVSMCIATSDARGLRRADGGDYHSRRTPNCVATSLG